jgi:hypothetical protein
MICSAELAHFSRLGRPRAAHMTSQDWNSRKRSCDVISIMESVGTLLPARKNPDPESNAPVRTSGRQHTFLCAASHVGAKGNTECVVARLRCKTPIAGTIFRVFLCARAAAVIPASTGEFAAATGAGYKAVGQLDKLR